MVIRSALPSPALADVQVREMTLAPFTLKEVHYRFADELQGARHRSVVFERGDAVAALTYHRELGSFVFVEQFRFPTSAKGPGRLLEIPAGMIEIGEDPAGALRRELQEETGCTLISARPIATFYPSPGACSERIHLSYAEVQGTPALRAGVDADEDIAVVLATATDLRNALETFEITDGKTLLALYWAQTIGII